jgi:hypothetical protein
MGPQPHPGVAGVAGEGVGTVGDQVVAAAEDAPHVGVGLAVQRQAESADAPRRGAGHRMARVFDQVFVFDHVNVGRLAVGQHQDHLVVHRLAVERGAGVAQRRAHARRQAALQGGQPGLLLCAERFVEVLDALVVHLVAAVGGEAVRAVVVWEIAGGIPAAQVEVQKVFDRPAVFGAVESPQHRGVVGRGPAAGVGHERAFKRQHCRVPFLGCWLLLVGRRHRAPLDLLEGS